MEVDISKKVNYAIKYGLPGLVLLALAASAAVWFWHSQQSYLVISDAKLTSAMVAARSSTPGTIESLLVEDGAKVEAGQVVAKIKVKVTPEQLQQLEQTLELAKKNYTSVLAGTVVSQPVGGSSGSGSQAEVERAAGKKARMDQLYELGAVSAMENLTRSGLIPAIRQAIAAGKPLLGICVGLQILFEGSDESPAVAGLGIFSGQVKKIVAPGLKIPHMGWNSLRTEAPAGAIDLFDGLGQEPYVYLVHSYHDW